MDVSRYAHAASMYTPYGYCNSTTSQPLELELRGCDAALLEGGTFEDPSGKWHGPRGPLPIAAGRVKSSNG